ncbi:molecular chaperone Hsp33 [Hathewaya proteolytica DSM 3090]|uniref:33 kDa chaperonin n=1 Tax=Hathewaya proteolytica DSM 3090 TaxID=1121331 RepID=A0A1M6QRT7_9CLOT|nr:Hsp33 family molecular chaperone HslO [Hathewaya proteolytica]SHK22875.1 molecular chaperone Hsp33 [Hathewaya proteolytica DSM 3090]
MKDELIRATACNGQVRILGAVTTELVNKAVKIHNTSATASAAMGRMLTAGVIMGSMLKSDKDKLSLKIDGKGPAGGVLVTAYSDGHVKGYMGNPKVDLPLNDKNKLDVAGIIGKDGELVVMRDMGLREPYIGRVPIYTGEIAEDIAYYYTVSEQTPSAVALGVLVDTDLSIKAAGGFIIQMLPNSDELLSDVITYRLEETPAVTEMISQGKSMVDILRFIFDGMELQVLETSTPEYRCDCSRDKVEKALISIGKSELENIIIDDKSENIRCEFCGTEYQFAPEDLKNLLNEIK